MPSSSTLKWKIKTVQIANINFSTKYFIHVGSTLVAFPIKMDKVTFQRKIKLYLDILFKTISPKWTEEINIFFEMIFD